MKITVNDIPPSYNRYMGNSHSHNVYRSQKEAWHWLIKAAIKERPEKPINRAVVILRYFFKTRGRRDPDNYSGKFIMDALVREKILKDDSFSNIELHLSGGYDKENPRTEIIIIDKESQYEKDD